MRKTFNFDWGDFFIGMILSTFFVRQNMIRYDTFLWGVGCEFVFWLVLASLVYLLRHYLRLIENTRRELLFQAACYGLGGFLVSLTYLLHTFFNN